MQFLESTTEGMSRVKFAWETNQSRLDTLTRRNKEYQEERDEAQRRMTDIQAQQREAQADFEKKILTLQQQLTAEQHKCAQAEEQLRNMRSEQEQVISYFSFSILLHPYFLSNITTIHRHSSNVSKSSRRNSKTFKMRCLHRYFILPFPLSSLHHMLSYLTHPKHQQVTQIQQVAQHLIKKSRGPSFQFDSSPPRFDADAASSASTFSGDRGSAQPSEAGADLRGSAQGGGRGSAQPSEAGADLRGSAQPSEAGADLRGSAQPSEAGGDLRGSAQPSEAGADLRGSAQPSEGGADLRGSAQPTEGGVTTAQPSDAPTSTTTNGIPPNDPELSFNTSPELPLFDEHVVMSPLNTQATTRQPGNFSQSTPPPPPLPTTEASPQHDFDDLTLPWNKISEPYMVRVEHHDGQFDNARVIAFLPPDKSGFYPPGSDSPAILYRVVLAHYPKEMVTFQVSSFFKNLCSVSLPSPSLLCPLSNSLSLSLSLLLILGEVRRLESSHAFQQRSIF